MLSLRGEDRWITRVPASALVRWTAGTMARSSICMSRMLRALPGRAGRVQPVAVPRRDKWAAWSVYEGLIGELPFRYVDGTVFTPQGMRQVRINAESEPDPGPVPVKFVSFEDYLLWRDVGLRGRFPDGRPDPSWRGPAGARDNPVSRPLPLSPAAALVGPRPPR